MDLMVVQSDLGFLEQLLMRSRLDAARDFMISSLAVRHAARYARRSGSALEVFQRRSSLRRYFFKIDVIVFSICCSKPSTVGLGFVKREDAKSFVETR